MTDLAADLPLAPAPAGETRRVARVFFSATLGFWRGASARRAWLLTGALTAALVLMVGVNVGVNRWQGWFFDALEKRDRATIGEAILVFPLLVAATAGVGVLIVLARETLQVRWREWITRSLLDRWLGAFRFRRLKTSGFEPANPEYRIADDVRMATEPITDLVIGLVTAVLSAATFFGILWSIGGSYRLGAVTIPAYFVLVAILYGATVSGLIVLVGRSLIGKVASRNEAEARFRFTLMLTRENADRVEGASGLAAERQKAGMVYDTVVQRWLKVVRQHGHITWITNGNGLMIAVVPLLLATPKYLAGELTLGEVVRLTAAFAQVQGAISWLVDNFRVVAQWAASAKRVADLTEAIDRVEGEGAVEERAVGNRQSAIGVRPA